MVKYHSEFVCQQCGYESTGWLGKCPECGSWGSLVETVVSTTNSKLKTQNSKLKKSEPVTLSSIPSKSTLRISTKISELDRVLGGGLISGQVVLLAGEPGIGKSTLLLQAGDKIASVKNTVLYVSGEESPHQLKLRANRLGIKSKGIIILDETDVDAIDEHLTPKPSLLIIDSIQTMSTGDLSGMAGSVGQVRECTFRLIRLAKSKNIPTFVVGHVTKEGAVAGPAVLMHLVDTVLWFEGDKTLSFRLLRAVKNRFGPTDEVGIFTMGSVGLSSVTNPAKLFLGSGKSRVSGSAVVSVMQGTRPILVEVQALVVPSKMAFPKRIAQGVDNRRFELLLAVVTRRLGLPLYEYDCYLNVVGGVLIKGDPSADLAICLAVSSAYYEKPLPDKLLAIGEVGLLGEIREAQGGDKRVREAKRLGYTKIITSKEVGYLSQAVKKYLSTRE
jgi:DNA repair protein RadA/Sms